MLVSQYSHLIIWPKWEMEHMQDGQAIQDTKTNHMAHFGLSMYIYAKVISTLCFALSYSFTFSGGMNFRLGSFIKKHNRNSTYDNIILMQNVCGYPLPHSNSCFHLHINNIYTHHYTIWQDGTFHQSKWFVWPVIKLIALQIFKYLARTFKNSCELKSM